MILAAGLGTRMQPLTNDQPKPLVEVGGKALIDWVLDDLAAHDVTSTVVNVHYKAKMLKNHLAKRETPRIVISDETEELLDTGGGVAAALPLFDDEHLLVTNSDALWGGGLGKALTALAAEWNDDAMDALILLAPMERAFGFDGAGDFFLNEDGTPARRRNHPTAPYVYAGTQIVHRRLFDDAPKNAFSFNVLWDAALKDGRLKAVLHDDDWYHVGTPDAVGPTGRALTLNSTQS